MAKPVNTKKTVNKKAIAAVTVAVLLVLSIVVGYLGVTGRKLDNEGLYKLLAWIPTTSEKYTWREALVPGADFGETDAYVLALPQEQDTAADDTVTPTVAVLSERMAQTGISGVAIETMDDGNIMLTLPKGALNKQNVETLTAPARFAFADPSGVEFLSGDHITAANIAPVDQQMTSWYLAFEFDAEGKQIFADKTTELVGQSIALNRDGQMITQASIGEPLTEGGASIPGFAYEDAFYNALLMRTGELPNALSVNDVAQGSPLLGEGVMNRLIIALWVACGLIGLYLIIRFRLGGLIALWALAVAMILNWFFAALAGGGFNVSTLLAVYGAFALAVFGILSIFRGMEGDLRRGRSAKQALKDSYAGPGHTSLDVLAPLLVLTLIWIIMDNGSIGRFAQLFAIALIVDMVIVHLLMRVMMVSVIELAGDKTAMFVSESETEEAK
jgi:preprotein translocase subunit SecD